MYVSLAHIATSLNSNEFHAELLQPGSQTSAFCVHIRLLVMLYQNASILAAGADVAERHVPLQQCIYSLDYIIIDAQ